MIVPNMPGQAQGQLSAQQPSQENLLMAAADMHRQGRLVDPQRSMPKGPQEPQVKLPMKAPRHDRPLKVVK